ncbi:MAG: hypothetical protein H7305_05165 [Gemmatimonadaceae bacterium]|nr:hypothetical protein [Gemmatimonadaceae bacterium]
MPWSRWSNLLDHLTFVTVWWSGTHDLADLAPGLTEHGGRWIAVANRKILNIPGSRTDEIIFERAGNS